MNWFNGARWRLSLSHCLEGLLIQIPVALLFGMMTGTVAVIVWYWSRKKLEVEMLAGHDQNPVSTWLVGWSFAQAGSPLFRPEALYRVTPQHLWMIAK